MLILTLMKQSPNILLSCFLLVLGMLAPYNSEATFSPLPIPHNGKYIYINLNGERITHNSFLEARFFSNGLALVRTEQGFGFINLEGEIVVQPKYDYAYDYENNRTVVYLDAQPYFIDREGTILFGGIYDHVRPFSNGRAIVGTKSGKYGALNLKGELVIDTIFSKIDEFESYVTRAYDAYKPEDAALKYKPQSACTIIDTNGTLLIPYENNYSIDSYQNNYFLGQIPNSDTSSTHTMLQVILNTKGVATFTRSYSGKYSLQHILPNDLVEVSFYEWYWDMDREQLRRSKDYSDGVMDVHGNFIYSTPQSSHFEGFYSGRCFIRNNDWSYTLVDDHFNVIPTGEITKITTRSFQDGYAKVTMDGEPVIIDRDGEIVFSAYKSVSTFLDDMVIYQVKQEDHDKFLFGLAEENRAYTEAIFEHYTIIDAAEGVVAMTYFEDDQAYLQIYRRDQVIWATDYHPRPVGKGMNTVRMNRAHFYASSEELSGSFGGYGRSENKSKYDSSNDFTEGKLNLILDFNEDITYGAYKGFKLIIHNGLNNRVYFDAQDSRLEMLMQAKNKKGEWQNIEYLPESWCGNSYHILHLKQNEYWEFTAPVYEGSFQTECRLTLNYKLDHKDKTIETIYSEPFKMNVNPGQFWNQSWYSPKGIMDPYYN
jgi:hypothetical protein